MVKRLLGDEHYATALVRTSCNIARLLMCKRPEADPNASGCPP